jgi:ribonuclease G
MSKVVKDSGIIIRTVAQNVDYEVLEDEYFLLKKRWEEIHKQFQRFKKPRLLHDEAEILEYLMREKYDSTVDEVVTNSKEMFSKLEKILKSFDKKPVKGKLRLCKEDVFDAYNVSGQLEALYSRKIEMECGGWLVVDRTEAFTIIDINSGSNVSSNNTRDMALETNVQAATEVARQLRLRNLSGIIIVDFIDMEQENDRMTILKVLNEELKKDKAKTAVMGFTKLGLVEITRKRTSPPVEELLFEKCPICHGEGLVFSPKRILKMISVEMEQAKSMKDVKGIQLNLHWSLSGYLNKEWRENMLKQTGFDSIDIDFSRKDPNGYDIKYKK